MHRGREPPGPKLCCRAARSGPRCQGRPSPSPFDRASRSPRDRRPYLRRRMISAAASPVRMAASACRPRARSRAVVSSAMRVCSALASARSLACASITWRYIVGAIPVCHGSTTSATLTTWIGRCSKIGHVDSTVSAAAEGTEPSVAKMTRLIDGVRETRTGHGARSTTSAETDPRRRLEIVP